jgi:GT2 family glycosyltransferase
MKVSVIVPTADRPDAIERLLASLVPQTVGPRAFEVVVVDDGTSPPVAAQVARFADRLALRCLWQPRGGPAAARNRAIALSSGELLLILNDDASAPPDLIERHLAAHARSPSPAAWLGGFDLAPDVRGPVARGLLELGVPFPFHQMRTSGPNPGRFFWTCNLSVPRREVLAAGGFDEGFRYPVCEDVDLGLALQKRGVFVHWLPDSACLHHHSLTARWFWRRQVMLGICIVTLWRKHRDPQLIPWLHSKRCQGNEPLFVQALEHLAVRDGPQMKQLASEIDDRIERGAGAGPLPPLAPLLQRIDHSALRLGLLSGMKGWSLEQAQRWLDQVPVEAAATTAS